MLAVVSGELLQWRRDVIGLQRCEGLLWSRDEMESCMSRRFLPWYLPTVLVLVAPTLHVHVMTLVWWSLLIYGRSSG